MRFSFVSAALVALVSPTAPAAQSLLDRAPNLSGTWVGEPGVVQFNFLHRFYVSPSPSSVFNFPTFTVSVGLPARTALGFRYASESELVATTSNEFELFGRWRRPLGFLTLAITPAYNTAAESFDAELGLDYQRGGLTLQGTVRGMTHAYGQDTARIALGGGMVWRLNSYVGVTGDFASLLDARPGEDPAWSAGLVFAIPGSPHTFSLHATNASGTSIQASSRKSPLLSSVTNKPVYGFEFTVPLHLNRFAPWFKKSGARSSAGPAPAGTTDIRINNFKFADTLTITVGQTVRWINEDPIDHTITFDGGEATSPPFGQGREYSHTFQRAGTYTYHCTPHPFMKGTIIVR